MESFCLDGIYCSDNPNRQNKESVIPFLMLFATANHPPACPSAATIFQDLPAVAKSQQTLIESRMEVSIQRSLSHLQELYLIQSGFFRKELKFITQTRLFNSSP